MDDESPCVFRMAFRETHTSSIYSIDVLKLINK